MTFQFGFRWMGITGWIFRISWVPLFGPTLKLALFWNGTLIRSAIGFCSFSASDGLSSEGADAGAVCAHAGPAGRLSVEINPMPTVYLRATSLKVMAIILPQCEVDGANRSTPRSAP